MAYDLEEQEQLETLKGWWKDNGTLLLSVLAAAAIAFAGWQAWRGWLASQALQAGTLYETLAKAVQTGDGKALREAGGALAEGYPRTLYASMGALATARFHFERGDLKNAKAQLQWVLEHSRSDELRDVARLRLAAVLVDERAYDEALKLLEEKHAAPLAAQYALLKGDILVEKKQADAARAAYRLALEKAEAKNAAFRDSVQLRLDALGG
ncbi:MAG: tetratricopeptide repeat protein [Betaproteobacteria bacterium]|nr:tetratricopeptide repeat protein [Betaproteobacteria bacterium]